MASIDERVVSMAFENAKFEAGVAHTMVSLSKLNISLQEIGSKNSLADIEKAANKVTLEQPMSALDKLKARFSRAGEGAAEGMNEIERAGNKVQLEQPGRALDKVNSQVAQVGRGAPDAFNEIERASGRVSLQGLTAALDSVTAKFSILEGAATVALGNIASQAVTKGLGFAKGFGVGPIMDGLREYELNLKSIQTIQANTDRPLTEINASLEELNRYSDQTIYNFSEMAKNIGTFTAAGVDLKTATSSIKGIANMAALSGSNSQQAATAMYQLSQAISSGKVGLQDWNSVVNAGMGGKKLQTALATTAIAMGDIKESSVKLEGPLKKLTINGESFRESLMAKPGKTSWLSSDVLVNTLATLDGRFSKAALSAELTKDGLKKYTAAQVEASIADSRAALEKKNGVKYTDEQFESLMKLSDSAFKSATEVKTLGQVFDVAKETIGSGWSASFQSIFGNLTEAKKLFTGMSGAINGFINANALARNELLAGWKKMGGRTLAIQGLKNIFKVLFDLLGKIGKAFREVFPRKTSQDLYDMTKAFLVFTAKLNNSPEVIDNIARTFKGLFAVLHIGWSVVKGVVGVIAELLGVVGKGSGGFLNFTGSIGDFLVSVDNALTKGGLLTSFFDGLASVLKVPLQLLTGFASALFGLFGGKEDKTKWTDQMGELQRFGKVLTPIERVIIRVKTAWAQFMDLFDRAKDAATPYLSKISEAFSKIGDAIGNALSGGNFEKSMSVLQTGFIGGIFLAIKKGIGGFGGELTKTLGSFRDVLGQLTGNLQTMQQKVKAEIILSIAAAIGILAASTFVLSKIDTEDLAKAMGAIAVGLGQLMGAMKLMTGGVGAMGLAAMPVLAVSLIALAAAMVILAGAVKIFSTMDWEELAKGLAGVGGGLTAIGVGMKFLGPGTIIQAPAILLLSIALNALALAVKQFAGLSWKELGRGLAGVLGSLVAMVVPLTAMGPSLILIGPGLMAVSFAMNMLAGAVRAFGDIPLRAMAKGIAGIAAAILAIGIAMIAIPPTVGLQAAGLVILAVALNGIAGAVKIFGSLGIGELVKGLIGLGGALAILAVGLYLMVGTLPGAIALTAAAVALALLAPTLAFLGTLEWSTIFKGLAAMALALGTLAIAGAVAAPGLVLLGAAMLPLSLVFIATATAAFIFAKALTILGSEGTKGIGVMIAAITAFVALLPTLIINFVKGLVDIVAEVAKIAPNVVSSLVKIIDAVIDLVIRSAPRLGIAIGTLINSFLLVVGENAPKIMTAGFKLLSDFLRGIDDNIGQIIPRVASIILKFLNGLATQAPDLMAAGARVLIAFLQGIANNLSEVVTAAGAIGLAFLDGVGQNLADFVKAGANAIIGFLEAIGDKLPDIIKAGVRVVTRFLDGVSSQFDEVATAATRFVTRFFTAFGDRENVRKMVDAGLKAALNILRGIADGIRKDENVKEIVKASADIGIALVQGIGQGLADLPKMLKDAVLKPVDDAVNSVKKKLGIKSPSKVFQTIGQMMVGGMSLGLGSLPSVLVKRVTNPLRDMLRENDSLAEFGKYMGTEFRQGLIGGLWDDGKSQAHRQIEGSFAGLRAKLQEQQDKLQEQIKAGQDKLTELLKVEPKERDSGQITKVFAELNRDKRLLDEAKAASAKLVASLQDEQSALVKLSYEYENVSKALERAKSALEEATRIRDDAIRSYTDQFSQLPNIGSLMDQALSEAMMTAEEKAEAARKKAEENEKRRKINQIANYKKALKEQIAATQKYMETLARLREAGLDDTTYKMLLSQGTAGQEFAKQLLEGGKGGIDELNKLNADLAKAAAEIAANAGTQLYQAGVDAAAGLVRGLTDRQAEVRKVMEQIAGSMIAAIKKQLGIRSPSRVFAEIGKFAAQGMVTGLKTTSGTIIDTAAAIGDEAAGALTNSLADISNRIATDIDTDLTITPVLDLTQVRKDASKMRDLTKVVPITAAASYGQASAISAEKQAGEAVRDVRSAQETTFNFEQNNYSPEALSDVEIYRQTNNQLAQLKHVVGLRSA